MSRVSSNEDDFEPWFHPRLYTAINMLTGNAHLYGKGAFIMNDDNSQSYPLSQSPPEPTSLVQALNALTREISALRAELQIVKKKDK